MQLKGVAAIVTGGASGLGASTARMLAGRGAQVAVFDVNEPVARDLVRDIGGAFCKVDVSEEGSVLEGLAEAQQRHGVARILVNCAGISAAIKTVTRHNACHPLDTFRRVIEINLIGTFNVMCKFAARLCAWETEEEERGVVINTASVAAYDGQIGQAAYAQLVDSIIANPMVDGEVIRIDGALRMAPR